MVIYKGQATGESFNRSGKTDILIRVRDKTIFIAECKIWEGPQSLSSAIDQLFAYTTWRDTKTAIIIFNRNRNLSKILSKIPDIVQKHLQYRGIRQFSKEAEETEFCYSLAHPSDPNREVILTILVFDVPEK